MPYCFRDPGPILFLPPS